MWAIWALTAFFFAVGIHAWLCRIAWRKDSVSKFLLGGMPIGCGLAAALLKRYGADSRALAGGMLYALICELYIFFFTMVSGSISASLLLKLRLHPLTAGEIEEAYSSRKMVRGRFGRLTATGLVLTDPAHAHRLTEKGARVLAANRRIRRFFHGAN